MEESSRLIYIAVSILIVSLIIGAISYPISIGRETAEEAAEEAAELMNDYDIAEIDNTEISGSAIYALIMRGVPVFRTAPNRVGDHDNRISLAEAKQYYSEIGWYKVRVVDIWNSATGVYAPKPHVIGGAP